MVGYVIYGRGSFNQLDEIIAPHRKPGSPMVFLVDHFFEGKPLASRVPLRGNDKIIFADVTYEPKTTYVDKLANELKAEFGTVSGVVGIGGGSTMDLTLVRKPAADEVAPWVIAMIKRGAPYPPPAKFPGGTLKFTETFFVDKSGLFQTFTLTEGQR